MVGYLIENGRLKFFAFHWSVEEFAGVNLQLYNAWTLNDLPYPFSFLTYPSAHTSKTSIISCLLITYTLSLCPK